MGQYTIDILQNMLNFEEQKYREIETFKRNLLKKLYKLVTPQQQKLFDRLYPEGVTTKELNRAIEQCSLTIERNTEDINYKNIESLLDSEV